MKKRATDKNCKKAPIKSKNNFYKLLNMQIYCENCKKHTESTHPKILVLIWNKKAKLKSKCAECLTDRMFFDKINDEYELEQLIKLFFFFFYCVFYTRTWRLIALSVEKILKI